MSKHYAMSIYDLNGKKLCTLYDSKVEQIGAAQRISIVNGVDGWKEIEFSISKYDTEGNYNHRWDYIRNENMVYLTVDGDEDVYCIKAPNDLHDSGNLKVTVTCNHICEELKTKNLYKYFDDTNGIGTCEELISKAIGGSGWTLVSCDTFLESDGITEKIRSYSCDAKTGAFNMIAGICDLFNAMPIFNGKDRTVEIKAKTNTDGWMEILFGKNLDYIKRNRSSSNIVTRLYVEGEYGDYGYVGIDNINPTGLPFILNFDYYKDLGLFTEVHEEAVNEYVNEYKRLIDLISGETSGNLEAGSEINSLIGSYGYAYYPVINGQFGSCILGAGINETDAKLSAGDTVAIVKADGSQEYKAYPVASLSDKIAVIKFKPTITGLIAAYEDKISTMQTSIETYLEKINTFFEKNEYSKVTIDEIKVAYATDDLSTIKNEEYDFSGVPEKFQSNTAIEYSYSIGVSENEIKKCEQALKEKMLRVIELIEEIDRFSMDVSRYQAEQEMLDDRFSQIMGPMLKDGYWSDDNYTVGQEQSLYEDAIEISKKLAYPMYTYSLKIRNLSVQEKYRDEEFKIAQAIRIYDNDLGINDQGIVSKMVIHPDDPNSDSISIETDLLDIGNKTFASILERVTKLAEQVRQNKEVYKRAAAIAKDGTFDTNMLSGAIDVMRTQLLSSASNWKTDSKGNILMEALDGLSAMMLCGNGFMIANSKTENGEWDWRTFGTGDGFAADMITTGYLNAGRIEAGSITTSHISSDVGSELDISGNSSIELTNKKISLLIEGDGDTTELTLTDEMIQAIADKFSLIADEIDLSANESITTTVSNVVADSLDEIVEEQFGNYMGYRIEIVTTSDVLSRDISATVLSVRVWNGQKDVTDEFDASLFNWVRTTGNMSADRIWNHTHRGMKSITLTRSDVTKSAVYQCELNDSVSDYDYTTSVLGDALLGEMVLGN